MLTVVIWLFLMKSKTKYTQIWMMQTCSLILYAGRPEKSINKRLGARNVYNIINLWRRPYAQNPSQQVYCRIPELLTLMTLRIFNIFHPQHESKQNVNIEKQWVIVCIWYSLSSVGELNYIVCIVTIYHKQIKARILAVHLYYKYVLTYHNHKRKHYAIYRYIPTHFPPKVGTPVAGHTFVYCQQAYARTNAYVFTHALTR